MVADSMDVVLLTNESSQLDNLLRLREEFDDLSSCFVDDCSDDTKNNRADDQLAATPLVPVKLKS